VLRGDCAAALATPNKLAQPAASSRTNRSAGGEFAMYVGF